MDKPFLTFNQQIEKLQNEYHLIVNDHDFAIEVLSSISYYDLINGYQSIYRSTGIYESGTTLEQLAATHIFNKNIQGILLKYCTYVENSFKTILAYVVAERFSEHQDEYLKIGNFVKSSNPFKSSRLKKLLSKLSNMCETCTDTPTFHYRVSKDHIPPWILFRNISFSDATDLFSFLKSVEKEYLFTFLPILNHGSLTFQDKVDIMLDALKLTRKFRNTIAHNLNFLDYRECKLNKKANMLFINSLVLEKELNKTRHDVWAMILSIVILLNNKYLIQNFLAELQSFMGFDESLIPIYCNATGIPSDYEDRIKTYINILFPTN